MLAPLFEWVQVPVRLREVVYTLSPFEQSVMNGLFKDLSYTVRP